MEQIVGVPGGGLQDFRVGQSSSSSSHVPAGVHEGLDEPGERFFSHFSPWEKSAEVAGQVGADMPRHVSSWTPAACEDLEATDEPAELEEDVELLIEEEEEEDPSGWYVSQSASGRTFYWHRSSCRPLWHLPPVGLREEQEGEEEEEEEEEAFQLLLMLHRVPLRLQALSTWQSCSVSWCCLMCTPFGLTVEYVRQFYAVSGWLSLVVLLVHVRSYVNVCYIGDKTQMLCIMAGMDQKDSTTAVVCLWLVLLVSRCAFLSLSTGLRCLASWSVWTRSYILQRHSGRAFRRLRQCVCKAGSSGFLQFVLCSLWSSPGL